MKATKELVSSDAAVLGIIVISIHGRGHGWMRGPEFTFEASERRVRPPRSAYEIHQMLRLSKLRV